VSPDRPTDTMASRVKRRIISVVVFFWVYYSRGKVKGIGRVVPVLN
jgi:hypothetical protein